MTKRIAIKYLLGAGMASLLLGVCLNANASGFQLFEYNGVNAGDFGAGAAASVSDASTAFSNPAGMTFIGHQQIVVAGSLVMTDLKFNGTETWSGNSSAVPAPLVPANFSSTKTGTAQGGVNKLIPAFYYVAPLSSQWAFGIGVASPFGLVTDYSNTSVVNYAATKTSLQVIDITPDLAFKATDKLSLGAGLDIEHLDAELDGMVGAPYSAAALGYASNALDSRSINEGDSWGYGWHAGIMYQLTQATRLGLAYHSQVHFDLTGTSKLEGPLANQAQVNNPGVMSNSLLKANVTTPPFTEFSVNQTINDQWSVAGSLIYTQWSYFNNILHIQNVQGVMQTSAISPLQSQLVTVNLPNNYHDTWRVALGTSYRPADKWILRAGVGYDESPIKTEYRSVRLPDANRYAVALGAHYQAVKTLGVDVGWTHLFLQNAKINLASATGGQIATTNGSYSNHADVVGAQLTWDIT